MMERVHAQLDEIIQRVGWAVIGVGAGEDFPQYSYTVGLTARRHPELGIVGLPIHTAQVVLNDLARKVHSGRCQFTAGSRGNGVLAEGYPLVMVAGRLDRGRLWPGGAYARYGHAVVRLLQVVYPDAHSRFPWEDGCVAEVQDMQRVIGRPPPRR